MRVVYHIPSPKVKRQMNRASLSAALKANDQPTVDTIVADLKTRASSTNEPRFSVTRADQSPSDVRYSVTVNPNLRKDVEAATNTDRNAGAVLPRTKVVEISTLPELLRILGYGDANIITRADILRKLKADHFMSNDQIADLPNHFDRPIAVFKDGNNVVILTDMTAQTRESGEKPVMVYLRPAGIEHGKHTFMASAYAREAVSENA